MNGPIERVADELGLDLAKLDAGENHADFYGVIDEDFDDSDVITAAVIEVVL